MSLQCVKFHVNYSDSSYLSYHSFIDIVNMAKPDERSIMTYVAAFYHAFSGNDQVLSTLCSITLHYFLIILYMVLDFCAFINFEMY